MAIVIAAVVVSAAILVASSTRPPVTKTVTSNAVSTSTVVSSTTILKTITATETVGTATETVTSVTGYGSPYIGNITVADLRTGSDLTNVAVDPSTQEVYVPDFGGDMLVINATSDGVSATPDNFSATYVAVDPRTDMVYTNNDGCPPCAESVVVVDGATNRAIGGIDLGAYVDGLDVNPNTDVVYASSADTDSLYVINGATDSLVKNISLGGEAMGVAVNDETNMVYVPVCTTSFDCTPAFLDAINGTTYSVVSQTPIGLPFAVAVNPVTDTIYVTTLQNLLVSIDGSTGSVTETRLSAYAMECRGLAVNTVSNEVYVSCQANLNEFLIVDGANDNILNSFVDNETPSGVAFDPSNSMIYLVQSSDGYVSVLRSVTYLVP